MCHNRSWDDLHDYDMQSMDMLTILRWIDSLSTKRYHIWNPFPVHKSAIKKEIIPLFHSLREHPWLNTGSLSFITDVLTNLYEGTTPRLTPYCLTSICRSRYGRSRRLRSIRSDSLSCRFAFWIRSQRILTCYVRKSWSGSVCSATLQQPFII